LVRIFRRAEIGPATEYHDRVGGLRLAIGAADIQGCGLRLQQMQRSFCEIGRGRDPEQTERGEYQYFGKLVAAVEQENSQREQE